VRSVKSLKEPVRFMIEENKITTFKRLMHEISYSYSDGYDFINHGNGVFCLNKLYIGPDFVSYKTESYTLDPEVYKDFLTFLTLIDEKVLAND
jgi:hypothetical protein